MKGTIHFCLEETIKHFHGEKGWQAVALANGYDPEFSYGTRIRDDIDEVQSIELFVISANTLGITLSEMFDQFGEYWCCEYTPKLYGVFYRGMKGTRDAVTKLDHLHETVTNHIPNSYPPRFDYNWLDEDTLEVTYKSDRNLVDLFISLVKGLDKKFGDETMITKLSNSRVLLKFMGGKQSPKSFSNEHVQLN